MTAAKARAKEVERDVEETRSEIDDTLDEIERRLSPGQLLDEAVEYFRSPRRRELGVGDAIRENPLPIALIGFGVAWLAFAAWSSSSQPSERRYARELRHPTEGDYRRRSPREPRYRRPAERVPNWPLPEVERNIVMAVSKESLAEWLRDARAMEDLAIETLEKQTGRLARYPQLQAKLREHVAESRRQAERLDECMRQLGTAGTAAGARADKFPGREQIAALLGDGAVIKDGIAGYAFEHFEIATYRTLIEAASEAGEPEVERVCRENLREEEAMADWLARHMPDMTRQYLYQEAAQRTGADRTAATTQPGAGAIG